MSPIAERITAAMAAGAEGVAIRSGVKGLTEEDVREGKTPEGIAAIWLGRMMRRKTNKVVFEQEEHEEELRERYGAVDGKRIPVRPTLDKEIEEGDEWEAGEYVLEVHSDGTSKNERVCAAKWLSKRSLKY